MRTPSVQGNGSTHFFTGFFQSVGEVAGPLNGRPFGIGKEFSRGCRGGHDDTHDNSWRKNALEVDLCELLEDMGEYHGASVVDITNLGVGESAHGTNVHSWIGDQLLQLWETRVIMISNELDRN